MNRSTRILITRRQRQRAAHARPSGWLVTARVLLLILLFTLGILAASAASVAALAGGVYYYFARDLPDTSILAAKQENFETVKIYDRSGQYLLYESIDPRPFRGDRTYVTLDQISRHLINATVALEDRSFWDNPGVNLRGLGRAFIQYNLQGGRVQGGSSITVQLVKQNFFTVEEQLERSYTRKIKEAILAADLTRRYDKRQILEWYLNNNFYGNFSYGIESAAQIYFNKPAADLTLPEAAMLAALPQFPGLNPFQAPEDAKRRQGKVLQALADAGYITQEQADAAFAEPLNLRKSALERFDIDIAPHFALYALAEVRRQFNTPEDPFFIWRKGLTVITTLDVEMQREITCIARQRIAHVNNESPDLPGCRKLAPAEGVQVRKSEEDPKVSNAAAVVMRSDTGEILALLGSLDYNNAEIDGEVNIALADRQPGSAFKPITYLTGFSQGLTAATVVMDVRQVFPDAVEPYTPENYDRRYHGPVNLRTALQRSYNIPAVWVMNQVGVKNVVNMAHRMGITSLTKDYYGLSLTLGGGEVKLLDLTYVFAVLANGGVMAGAPVATENLRPGYRTVDPVVLLEVRDREGTTLYKFEEPVQQRVISPQLNYLTVNVLSDPTPRPPAFGVFSQYLQLADRPIIAKTGTTNDYRDSWTLGASPQIAVGVWVGNADNTPMDRVSGSVGAAPIFKDIMTYAHAELPVQAWEEPEGMTRRSVCADSGLLPTDLCGRRITELFIAGTEPTDYDTVYQVFEINRENGKLATPYTSPDLIDRRVYRVYPPVAADWMREQAEAGLMELPPREYDDTFGPVFSNEEVTIARPAPFSYTQGVIEVLGNARSGDFRLYQLHFGQGLQPQNWQQIGPDHYNQVDRGVLEYWDTTSLNGPYTLRLTVIENSEAIRQSAIPITIDNTPPTIKLTQPANGREYVKEDDEWVNINALATDDWAMDRVVFYLDDSPFFTSTVAPYNIKWTITMSDTVPDANAGEIRTTEVITNPDGSLSMEEKVVSSVQRDPNDPNRLIWTFANGFGVIHDSGGYTETHVIKAKAYDIAGNEAESEPVRIFVSHEEDKGPGPRAALLPPAYALLPPLPTHAPHPDHQR